MLRRVLLSLATAVTFVLVAVGGPYLYVQHGGNFHAVEPGVYYRSAQLSGAEFRQVLKSHQIRTVLNLRGANAGKPWYDDEVSAAQAEGVLHLDYALSARHELTAEQIKAVLELVEAAPKPILVHCNAGADRTGLVSALYQLSRGKDLTTAAEQLSLRYGHFPYLGSATIAMDNTFVRYVAARR